MSENSTLTGTLSQSRFPVVPQVDDDLLKIWGSGGK
jgi:hypothetical protein